MSADQATPMSVPETIEEAVERLVTDADAQGFGRHVTDPAVLDRIAGLVVSGRPSKTPPRRRNRGDRASA